jgi:hypothetical protein
VPLAIGLGLGALGSVVSGGLQSSAAKGAAQTQANAANNAANLQFAESQQANNLIQSIYGQNVARLQPFVGAGEGALTSLSALTGAGGTGGGSTLTGGTGSGPLTSPLTAPFTPTMTQLSQTPGYQFALQQGQLATQAGSSAVGQGSAVSGAPGTSGIGPSGPLGKALANYSEGLASTTYQQQFQNYLTQNQQIYSMLSGLVNQGEGAAAGQATAGTTAGGQGANALIAGAQGYGSYSTAGAAATAAGTVGSASALGNAATGIGNNALLYGVLGGGASGGAFSSLIPSYSGGTNNAWTASDTLQ